MNQSKKMRLTGRMRNYLSWPFWLALLLAAVNVGTYFLDQEAGCLVSCGILIYLTVAVILYRRKRPVFLMIW